MKSEKSKEKNLKYNKKLTKILLLILIFSHLSLLACRQEQTEQEPITKTGFALDTIISITVYNSKDEEKLSEAMDIVSIYEGIYSRTLETSELYQLNNRTLPTVDNYPNTYEISDELSEIINYGLKYSQISDGSFDITIEPLSSLWDFKSKNPKVPERILIDEAVSEIGYEVIELEGNRITLNNDKTRIELGAIAKGYIADKVKEYLISKDVNSAIINLGGNILCVGEKPSNEPFNIGIQKPFADRNEVIATMDIKDKSVVTSGVYERHFKLGDKVFHHIINPETGFPYDNNLISVTIISDKSVDGDGLSTSCFALGLDKGIKLIDSLEDTHAIFITKDYEFHYSKGFYEDIDVRDIF